VLSAVVLYWAAGVRADDASTRPAATANPAAAKPVDPAVERQRQETAAAAVWVLVGVAILGLSMLVLVILLGGHTRRIARAPLPERSRDDPFWYLRPERERASEANVGEERQASQGDEENARSNDA
jgi:hypothetical protein